MQLCITVECITSSLQFLQHCLSVFLLFISNILIRSHPLLPWKGAVTPLACIGRSSPPLTRRHGAVSLYTFCWHTAQTKHKKENRWQNAWT